MNFLEDLILPSDFARLLKYDLKSICSSLGVSTDGNNAVLADAIWKEMKADSKIKGRILNEWLPSHLLAGKTAVTWFRPNSEIESLKSKIISNYKFNIFENIRFPESTTNPELSIFGGFDDIVNGKYFFRFALNGWQSPHWEQERLVSTPKVSFITAIYFVHDNLLEVRAEPTNATRIATWLASVISDGIVFQRVELNTKTGSDIGDFADVLNGRLVEAVASPELSLTDFSPEQATAMAQILSALDQFFVDDDGDKIIDTLRQEGQVLMEENLVPLGLTSLILMGLEKVGMGVDQKDLRRQPLYEFLQPYLKHHTGFIELTVKDNGELKNYTVRIGLTTNSVYFATHATETVIQYVRERIVF